jgi:hypothetical protein
VRPVEGRDRRGDTRDRANAARAIPRHTHRGRKLRLA